MSTESSKRDPMYYFCFGSNLLTTRMMINNKTAVKVGLGLLQDFQLTFSGHSDQVWLGSTANITPAKGSKVIGVVWTLEDFAPLDKQEVHYDPIQVEVQLLPNNDGRKSGEVIDCRTYVQQDEYRGRCLQGIPSRAYKNVMLSGMRENSFPEDYIKWLRHEVKDNGLIPEKMASLIPECRDEDHQHQDSPHDPSSS